MLQDEAAVEAFSQYGRSGDIHENLEARTIRWKSLACRLFVSSRNGRRMSVRRAWPGLNLFPEYDFIAS